MIRALFFDIDGTLVSFNTHKVAQSTIDGLNIAKERGIKIFISTGRPLSFINNLEDIEHLIDGYITTNGSYNFMGKSVISMHSIPKEEVLTLVEFFKSHHSSLRNNKTSLCLKFLIVQVRDGILNSLIL